MSITTAKASQAAAREKAKRLCSMSNTQKPFYPQGEKASDKTGMSPVSAQATDKKSIGGKIKGPAAMVRADRVKRKAGGRIANEIANTDLKQANKARKGGDAHEGGLKKGGAVKKAMGGGSGRRADEIGKDSVAEMKDVQRFKTDRALAAGGIHGMLAGSMRKDGGKVKKSETEDCEKDEKPTKAAIQEKRRPVEMKKKAPVAEEVEIDEPEDDEDDEDTDESALKKGGRVKKYGGGALAGSHGLSAGGGKKKSAKAKTKGSINIIIAGNPNAAAAPMGPAMGAPMVPGPRAPAPVAPPVSDGPNPPPPGGPQPMPPMGAPMMPPGMPQGGPPMPPEALMRNAGGRIGSFKAMKAGAGSGLGRLKKAGLASGLSAPGRK